MNFIEKQKSIESFIPQGNSENLKIDEIVTGFGTPQKENSNIGNQENSVDLDQLSPFSKMTQRKRLIDFYSHQIGTLEKDLVIYKKELDKHKTSLMEDLEKVKNMYNE